MKKVAIRWKTAAALSSLFVVVLAGCNQSSPASNQAGNQPPPNNPPKQKPAEPAAPAANGSTNPVTGAEWDKIVELAKKEGEVLIVGQPKSNRETLVKEFEKKYPGIKVKYTGMRPSEVAPKLLAEQQQGKYLTDILLEGGQNAALSLYPAGALENFKSFIPLSPEIKDDKNWHNGFETGYKMSGDSGQYTFGVIGHPTIFINQDVIPEGELKSFKDLLNPKYKGKIVINDFSAPAQGTTVMAGLYLSEGEEFINQLMKQDPVIVKDLRQMTQWFATGKHPIGIGMDRTTLTSFRDQGVIKKVGYLEPEKSTFFHALTIAVLKTPPHPNATKVFVNWFMSKEGQTDFVKITEEYQSRRKDVAENPNPEIRGWNKMEYKTSILEKQGVDAVNWTTNYGKKIAKPSN